MNTRARHSHTHTHALHARTRTHTHTHMHTHTHTHAHLTHVRVIDFVLRLPSWGVEWVSKCVCEQWRMLAGEREREREGVPNER